MLRHKICKNNQPFEQILLTDNIIYVRFRNCFIRNIKNCVCDVVWRLIGLSFFCVFIFVSYQKQEPSDLLRLITITLSLVCASSSYVFMTGVYFRVPLHYAPHSVELLILMTNYCNSYIRYKLLNICQNDRLVK